MPFADGTSFAGYTIIRCLGAGGMGEVYVAAHPRLPRHDALKVLRTEVSTDPDYRERFLREADMVATLSHPHIVGVHDRGEEQGKLWISMEYVDGPDAGRLLSGQFPEGLPPGQVVRLVRAVAEALDYAHQRNLLHRDVKPANILIGQDDNRIMLADFGIARHTDESNGLTATNMTIGTASYAPPEQLMGAELDGRADQYALAATAFHLLTGAPPFVDPNPAVVIGKHLSAPPPSLGRPELAGADPVLAKALAKNPADRFDRCTDFARALAHQLGSAGSDATMLTPTAQHIAELPVRSRRSLLIPAMVIAVLAVSIAVAAVLFGHHRDDRPEAPKPATPTSSSTVAPPIPTTTEPTVTVESTVTVEPPAQEPIQSTQTTQPTSTETPQPEEESPIRQCMQQTGKTRLQCWEEIRRSRRR